ncbi:MAG TPA: hypothetical protein VKW76_10880 [Candidatus Binatia bacterium]|nr:hypothetical protein [Candidatus Binatia bacterium]
MRVYLDGAEVAVPAAVTLGELLGGIAPLLDPARLVTQVEVDGRAASAGDERALAGWRLRGEEVVIIGTETPQQFAVTRRAEIPGHLERIADMLAAAADGLRTGETADANRLVARATRELRLVIELDRSLLLLEPGTSRCRTVAETIRRIGPRLEDAGRARRWDEMASLLSEELVPALRTAEAASAS